MVHSLRRIGASLVLLLILCFVLVSFPKMGIVKAEPKTIVVPDDYATIQEAVDAASEGDTVFVKNGVYSEPVEIHKPLTLLGEDSQNTILEILMIRYWPPRVILVSADNVTISGFNIINSDTGIWVETFSKDEPDDCRIVGNNFLNNSGAINYYEGTNLTISGNNITGCRGISIYLGSSNCTVSDNNITNNYGPGISAYDYNLTIKGNRIKNNTGPGINLSSGPFYVYENNIERNSIGVELLNIRESDEFHIGSGNVVYCNNFIDNSQQVLINKEYWLLWKYNVSWINGTDIVSWDNGTTGNYWNSYDGTDNDANGVGDTPYIIDESSQDNFPLMLQWYPPTEKTEHFSATLIAAVILIVAVVVAFLVYIVKNKKTIETTSIRVSIMDSNALNTDLACSCSSNLQTKTKTTNQLTINIKYLLRF